MRAASYQAYIDQLCTTHLLQQHRRLLLCFAQLDMDQRSAVAKLCRAQRYPPKCTRLHTMTKCIPSSIRSEILSLCQTPVMAGLILHLIHVAPMSQREVDIVYASSMKKEYDVMESVCRECTIDFNPFFGSYNSCIHPLIRPNPRIAKYIHTRIDSWIDDLKKNVLYPRISSKTVSKITADDIRSISDYEPFDDKGITPIDLERVYHQYGYKAPGPCEMRQKWYCSNLKPRTYYTQGGDAYHTAKYLAKPLVDLCDILPATNRKSRVVPGRITISNDSQDVIYYDLTSFTSNLHVHRNFMYMLARYCAGHIVQILDSYYGVQDVDLGDLIYEYTDTNLCLPSYTLPSKYADPSVEHYHNIAGFLGVYGNIASATFIHGITMAMLHDSFDESNIAGDDGLDVTQHVDFTLTVVGLLGKVEDSKTFRESEGCAIHLKRPIRRVGNRLLQGDLITWPSLEQGETDIDSRYPYLERLTKRERKDMIAGSVLAFLRKLENQQLSTEELDLVHHHVEYIYRKYGLPKAGCVPQLEHNAMGFVPAYEKRYIGMDPITNTIKRNYVNVARIPLRGVEEYDTGMLNEVTFRCNQTKLLRHLVVLGYLQQEKEDQLVFGYEGLQLLLKEYIAPDPIIYTYKVVRKLPNWTSDIVLNS